MADELQGGAPPAPAPTSTQAAPPAPEATVPYARFAEVVQQKNQLLERASRADSLASALQEAQSKIQATEQSFQTFRTVASTIGHTDPEAVELVQWSYGRLPQENRPALGDWLSGVKADPQAAPLAIRHLLPQAPPPPVTAPPAPVPTTSTPPSATASGTPATSPRLADADVARIRAEAQRTGDWSRWREVRGKI